jgi:pimeloyl-[acyl-carrier protein] methyl ester esterase
MMKDKEKISLVLLPGLDGTGELFQPLLSCFPEWIKTVVVPYPRDRFCSYEGLKSIIMESLPIGVPFFILGESFSGPLAVKVSHNGPEGLRGIVLCATFVRNPFIIIPSWLKILSVTPLYMLWPLLLKIRALYASEKYREIANLGINAVKTVDPNVIAKRVKEILSVNVENDLRSCDVPILYIMGTRDHLIRRHNFRRIQKIKNNIQLAEINTLHFVLQLEPRKSADILMEFMGSNLLIDTCW